MEPDNKDISKNSFNRATPRNTTGMGNLLLPGMKMKPYETACISAKDFHSQKPGSGDSV